MLKWINKLVDNYILSRCIEADFFINTKDQEYLKKIGKDQELIRILDKIASSVIFSSITCKSIEGLSERNGFLKAINFLKKEMKQDDTLKIDKRTGERID